MTTSISGTTFYPHFRSFNKTLAAIFATKTSLSPTRSGDFCHSLYLSTTSEKMNKVENSRPCFHIFFSYLNYIPGTRTVKFCRTTLHHGNYIHAAQRAISLRSRHSSSAFYLTTCINPTQKPTDSYAKHNNFEQKKKGLRSPSLRCPSPTGAISGLSCINTSGLLTQHT